MNNTGSALFNLSPKFYSNFRQKFLYFQNEPWFHLRVHLHPLHPLILGLPKCTLAFILGVHLHLLHPPWIRAWLKVLLVSRLLMGWKLQIRGYKFVNLIVFEKCALPAIMVKFFWSWLSKVGAGLVHSDHGFLPSCLPLRQSKTNSWTENIMVNGFNHIAKRGDGSACCTLLRVLLFC